MTAAPDDVERREKAARTAIREALGTAEDETGATLFVEHHLAELEASYWERHLGTARPEPGRVLDLLELRSHWGDEGDEGLDNFDFTLPGGVTDYVISVRFDEEGRVEGIEMES